MKKNKTLRTVFAALLTLALAFTLLAGTVLAEGISAAPLATSSDPIAPVPTSNLAISAYAVVDAAGNAVSEVKPGDKVTLAFTLYDTAIANSLFTNLPAQLSVNTGTGSFSSPREVVVKDKTNYSDVSSGIAFSVLMYDVVYNGGDSNYTFTIAYHDASNAPLGTPLASFTQNIIQCKNVEATPGAKPTIVPTSISASTTDVYAGESFSISGTMKNTSSSETVENVTAMLTGSEKLKLANGSNTVFLGNVAAGASLNATFALIADNNAEPGSYQATITYSGTWNGEAVSCTQEVAVNVTQKERFEISRIEPPEMLYAGEEQTLTLYYVNKGKGVIYNLSAEIKGDMANPGQSQYIGNVNAGTENSVDFAILGNEAGTITGTVVLSYEDNKGNLKTLEKEFSCIVQDMPTMDPGIMDPGIMDPGMEPGMEGQGGIPVWVWILVGLGVVIVGAVTAVIILKKKKAKKLALEDEDEDI